MTNCQKYICGLSGTMTNPSTILSGLLILIIVFASIGIYLYVTWKRDGKINNLNDFYNRFG